MRPEPLTHRIVATLEAHGLEPGDASDVAGALVATSLRGVDTHGIRLLPTYLRELTGGRARARPQMKAARPKPALATLDADGALGIVAGLAAARLATEIAAEQGVGWVAVTNSNHFGAASVYTLEICAAGMVGIAFSNADALMVPSPGLVRALGTNPVSIAAPTDGAPFCLDMATSQIAWSRIVAEWKTHGTLPAGWALDARGRDCAAPGAGEPVIASPLGGYKGAGLALAVELLCAGIAGGRFGRDQSHLYGAPWDTPREVSHAVMAIDLAALGAPEVARRRIGALLAWYRSLPTEPAGGLHAPGDLEAECAARRRGGIPVELAVLEALGAGGVFDT